MKIEGLTPIQREIADVLWSLGTTEECQRWLNTLSPGVHKEALIVMELMLLASIDDYVDNMWEYPDAEAIIEKMKK